MDIATIIGLILGAFFVFYGIVTGEFKMDNFWAFINPPSMMIVGGGLLGATALSFPMKDLLRIPKVFMVCIKQKKQSPVELINKLVQFAEVARRDGILALEGVTEDLDNEFLVRGIQLAVDGTDPELIEQIMNTELDNLGDRHATGKRMFDVMTKYAPAWGMIGTVIGLILMLKGLGAEADPGAIGQGMAVALVTTFYGAFLSNYLFNPIADKLVGKQDEELLMRSIVVRGVLAIQSGDNPRIVEQKLRIFLPPGLRAVESRR
jgi:chemotaxis protein MotA